MSADCYPDRWLSLDCPHGGGGEAKVPFGWCPDHGWYRCQRGPTVEANRRRFLAAVTRFNRGTNP